MTTELIQVSRTGVRHRGSDSIHDAVNKIGRSSSSFFYVDLALAESLRTVTHHLTEEALEIAALPGKIPEFGCLAGCHTAVHFVFPSFISLKRSGAFDHRRKSRADHHLRCAGCECQRHISRILN